ncbi:hypothetical protein JD974_03080 [Chromobacterium haemolyticum]|uniref:Uncharacterized protein n=1 Tax=Chromobacterium haemolyticum TaxID=394935 RepID=A0ABS3GHG3_9NEIS|nr:hypothetical protein [Chromobacterium haemolyticum]MBK0413380.1 hypothetical protein [Chromobacterium haemolyticum]MBO0414482.1 hypothetical protein [Chromobacterium haemolyticum]MBO0497659.1 hypothetical protein [Chromobacterium haemolyticum]
MSQQESVNPSANGFFSFLKTGAFLVGTVCSALQSQRNNALGEFDANDQITTAIGPLRFSRDSNEIYTVHNESETKLVVAITSTDNSGQAKFNSFIIDPKSTYIDKDKLIPASLTGKISFSSLETNTPMFFTISDWSYKNPFRILDNTLTINYRPNNGYPILRIAADKSYQDIRVTIVSQNNTVYNFGPVSIDPEEVSVDIPCPQGMEATIPFKLFNVWFTPTDQATLNKIPSVI